MNERNRGAVALGVAGLAALIAIVALGRPINVNVTGTNGGSPGPVAGITVSGDGVVNAVPNIAYLDFGVQGIGSTVNAARSEAAAAATRVLDALRALGIDEADIRTTSLSLYPTYPTYQPYPCYTTMPVEPDRPVSEPSPGDTGAGSSGGGSISGGAPIEKPAPPYCDPGMPQQPTGWTYAQSFEVTVRDIDKAGDTLDAATKAGVTQIGGIRFDLDNRDALMAQARNEAVKVARAKAEAMAKAAGTSLGAILSISETNNYPGPWYYGAKDVGGVSTPVAPGTMDITVTVTMAFALGG